MRALRKRRHLEIKSSIWLKVSTLACNDKERRGGFDCPLSCQQVGIWINTATTLASTIAWLIVPMARELQEVARIEESDKGTSMVTYLEIIILIFLSAVFFVNLIMTVILAYICTAAIPTDILVSKQRELKKMREVFRPLWEDTYEPMDLFCNICQSYV